MKTIGDLLSRKLDRKIEEIIQVDQTEEQSVYDEITEYVATDSIRDQYAHLLKAIADAPAEPNESVGVWISGFFGSEEFVREKPRTCSSEQESRRSRFR